MGATLEFDGRDPMTYEAAANIDKNIINELAYDRATQELYEKLWDQKQAIGALTKHHLGLGHGDVCTVLPQREWLRGAFNMSIPVNVTSGTLSRKFVFRCLMPHKLAEGAYPGTVDEKLGSEVGTYAWMQDNCPTIRIPNLFGFGFSDHRHFTHEEYRPWYTRIIRTLQRFLYKLFQYPSLSYYTANPTSHSLPTAYLLLEHIGSDVGQVLSDVWDKQRDVPAHRHNLFQGVAQLMLSLARVPQPRIGSFQFQDDCTITLTNRPLTSPMMIFENDGTPRTIQKTDTFVSTDSYVSDMLRLHDNRFLSNPNAIYDDEDCRGQMATLTLLRALAHHYIRRGQNNGPFLLQLTDLNAGNIFVDKECNITCLGDLEWVCSLPVEMLAVPYWLTGCAVDEMQGERFEEFNKIRQEFMHIFKEEERQTNIEHDISLARVMKEMWESNGVWFWHCIESVNAMLYLVEDHICPWFSVSLSPDAGEVLSGFWRKDSTEVVEKKVADLEKYDQELRKLFDQEP